MFFTTDDDVNVVQFGTGDIAISGSLLDDVDGTYGAVSLIPQEKAPIGKERDFRAEHDGECVLDTDLDVHTRLVFTKTASIDVLIKHLLKAKAAMIKEQEAEVAEFMRKEHMKDI